MKLQRIFLPLNVVVALAALYFVADTTLDRVVDTVSFVDEDGVEQTRFVPKDDFVKTLGMFFFK